MLVFEERGKPEYLEENLSEQRREPTNSTYTWRRHRDLNMGHIGGRRVLSPLRHPCYPRWPLVQVRLYTRYSWSPQYSILGRLQNSRVFTLKIVFFLRCKVYKPHRCVSPQSSSPFTLLLQNFCLTTHRSLIKGKIWAILQSTPKVF